MSVETIRLTETIFLWHRYDSIVKAELFSTALKTGSGVVVIDPIELPVAGQKELQSLGTVVSILITNVNHARAAESFSKRYGATIFAPAELAFPGAKSPNEIQMPGGLLPLPIDGAAPGEQAFYDARDGGSLTVGDAVINFGSSGFALLPKRYCTSQKRMMVSLRHLLDFDFMRILFAHGEPIVTRARERLRDLLENE